MKSSSRMAALAVAIAGIGVSITGCGSSGGKPAAPTPAPGPPPGPIACTDKLKRGHCSSCYWTGSETTCKGCTGHYTFNAKPENPDLYCTVNCTAFTPKSKPEKPTNVQALNGVEWPSVCIGESTSKFFTIGDWGGVCGWGNQNVCKKGVKPAMCSCGPDCGDEGKPCPMPNRPGGAYNKDIDGIAQRLVSDRMLARQQDLKKAGTPARFILNVGDNFYPGGIDTHCGHDDESATIVQFQQGWKDMYTDDLQELEWWSVLGNHDYGGVCYIKGWDQQIYFTWHDDKWLMPGQFWKRTVQYENFKAEFFFIDGNIFDTTGGTDPNHNLCSRANNPGLLCALANYPGDGANCAVTGPHSQPECQAWFLQLWEKNYKWLNEEVPKSDAEWQILVSHYPPSYNLGQAPISYMTWSQWLEPMGIDLMVTGHTHEQRVYYGNFGPGLNMGATAWVITGGGGGVTTESGPHDDGEDDTYGFMEVTISLHSLDITAYSHGGVQEAKIIRNQTSVTPVARKSLEELASLGFVQLQPSLKNLPNLTIV